MTHDIVSYFEIFYVNAIYIPGKDDKDDCWQHNSTYERRNDHSSYSTCTASIRHLQKL